MLVLSKWRCIAAIGAAQGPLDCALLDATRVLQTKGLANPAACTHLAASRRVVISGAAGAAGAAAAAAGTAPAAGALASAAAAASPTLALSLDRNSGSL